MIIVKFLVAFLFVIYHNYIKVEARPSTTVRPSLVQVAIGIHSDTIVTSGFNNNHVKTPPINLPNETDENQPGWLRSQLLRFGELTGIVGNKLGGFTSRVAGTLDKLCEVIKTVIPVIAAVCHVGQFQFCGSINDAPQELADAMSSSNLNIQD